MLLRVEDLAVAYGGAPASASSPHAASAPPVVDGVSLSLEAGGALALVGESGSGKTTTALALMGLLPSGAVVVRGAVHFEGRELLALGEQDRAALRGRRMAMVFQEAGSALHPLRRVIDQVAEPIGRRSDGPGREAARREAVALLSSVGIGDAAACAERYPHQLSGGQRQRVLLAMALGGQPSLLIADEPTGSLDATVAAEVLDALDALRAERGLALLHVTHDLALAAERSDEVAVLFAGAVVETGPAAEVLARPAHPYTHALAAALDRLAAAAGAPSTTDPPSSLAAAAGGCRFRGRCPVAQARCAEEAPPLAPFEARRAVRCHFPLAA